jgi:hypothetical protein
MNQADFDSEEDNGMRHGGFAPTARERNNERLAMLTACRLVEEHIRVYGYVPHPDKMKEAIAAALARVAS